MLDCYEAGELFKGNPSSELRRAYEFKNSYITQIAEDPHGTYTNCRTVVEAMGYKSATEADCENVRYIRECVSSSFSGCQLGLSHRSHQ